MSDELESEIERPAMAFAVAAGWKRTKIMRAYPTGFPDNFLARKDRGVILIEFKRPGKDLEPQQEKRVRELREAGVTVYVIDNLDKAKAVLR